MIVMKFGGSSLATSDALTRVAGLIADRAARAPVVVVSAMGRTTDGLVAAVDLAAHGGLADARRRVAAIRDDLLAAAAPVLADVAGLERLVDAHCDELDRTLAEIGGGGRVVAPPRLTDAALSHGERISSLVMARLLGQRGLDAVHVDACDVPGDRQPVHRGPRVRPDERAESIAWSGRTRRRGGWRVMGGFIARTVDGHLSTLGRGGSDFSASIIGGGHRGPTRYRSGPTSTAS